MFMFNPVEAGQAALWAPLALLGPVDQA